MKIPEFTLGNTTIGGVRTSDEYLKVMEAVCPELADCEPGQLESEKLPLLKNVVYIGDSRDCPKGMYTWDDIMALGKAVTDSDLQARQDALDPDDVINMQYTSGTTGFPKGVMLTHTNIIGNAKSIGECMNLTSMDENGYCKITGRIKDMIIRGGENIYPREIEEFLYTHPKILDVQVVGVPSEKYGEEVAAYIQLRNEETAEPEEFRDFCDDRIAFHKIPAFSFLWMNTRPPHPARSRNTSCGSMQWRRWSGRQPRRSPRPDPVVGGALKGAVSVNRVPPRFSTGSYTSHRCIR